MAHKRRPSLLGALLLTGIGVLFLMQNFGFGPGFWSLARHYWPVLLILLGAGKIIEYFFKKDSVSIRAGEIVGILFLLFFGFVISKIFYSPFGPGPIIPNIPNITWNPPSPSGPWIGDSHTYTEEASYPLESPVPIRIENTNGSISISPGSDQEIRVRLKKVISGSASRAREVADELHLEGILEGSNESLADPKPEDELGVNDAGEYFVIRTNRESIISRDFRFNTDMEITVPKDSQIQVRNTLGELRVSDINGTLDLRTRGNLEVRNCTGDFTVSNRFADSRLINLEGNVSISSRGNVYVEDVRGDVTVNNDNSKTEILDVDGEVFVSSTEGSLRIERITKPVVIEGRATQIRVGDLNDRLKISAIYRSVHVFDVASDVVLECRYCTPLSLKNIEGDIQIESESDNINADNIRGRLTLQARASGLRLDNIVGNLDVRTTLKDVIVNGFEGSCSIINEYANVSLSARSLEEGDVYVRNRNGGINMFLPENSSFEIDAIARNGRVDSDYRGLASARNENNTGVLRSKVREGGPTITLETEYSNIKISRARAQQRSHVSNPQKVTTPITPHWSFDFDTALSIIGRSGAHALARPAESLIGGLR